MNGLDSKFSAVLLCIAGRMDINFLDKTDFGTKMQYYFFKRTLQPELAYWLS